jgi:hypothetical protein
MLRLSSCLAVAFLISASTLFAQSGPPPTNSGTDFLLCFERNDLPEIIATDLHACDIYLANASRSDTTTITVTCRHFPSMHKTFVLAPRDTISYRISDEFSDLWINGTDSGADDRVVHVASTQPIICYGMNYKYNSCDAFMAIPKDAAGTDYRIMSYTNSHYVVSPMPSEFAVAAFSDNTHVTIIPAANTLTDAQTKAGHAANVPFTVTLMAGECIQVQTDPTIVDVKNPNAEDLTGSIVFSDSVVAVYAGHARAEVPFNYEHNNATSRDVLIEQMPPTDSWGQTFVVAPIQIDAKDSVRPEGDLIRVLALNDSTAVSINGMPWTSLQAGGYADSMIHNPLLVEASGPVLVAEYAHTSTNVRGDNGDPFLAIIPSVDQTFNDYPFFASNNPVFVIQKVMIAADAACTAQISYDNTLLPSAFFKPLPISPSGRGFAMSTLNVTAGFHRLSTPVSADHAFSILSYGLGFVVSYGYTGGALLKPLHAIVVNPQSSGDRQNNEIGFRNITAEVATIDSVRFTTFSETDANYAIAVVLRETDRYLVPGKTATLQLQPKKLPTATVHGRLELFSHTATWHDLKPTVVPVTYHPASAERVASHDIQPFEVYPNPASTRIEFTNPNGEAIEYSLLDPLGREALTGKLSGAQITLDVSKVENGVYFLHVYSPRGSQTAELLIRR